MKYQLVKFSFFSYLLIITNVFGQVNPIKGKTNLNEEFNPLQTAVPFLSIAPNARAAGMGDMGVATSADENSAYWNPGKLCRIENDYAVSLSVNPWLRIIATDMYHFHLATYYKLRKEDVIGLNFTYFNLGKIDFTDASGGSLNSGNPNELCLSGTYSRLLSDKFSTGVTLKYIYSNLLNGPLVNASGAHSAAADVGFYYVTPLFAFQKEMKLTIGAMLNNIGSKINYRTGIVPNGDYLPSTIRLGAMNAIELDEYNKLSIGVEFSKLMTPTPNSLGQVDKTKGIISSMLGSFIDAPGGFGEEMREIMISAGLEYWYDNLFAVRGGYFHESLSKGSRKYFSLGLGIKYTAFGFDIAYLIPTTRDSPLANTLRFTLSFNFNKPDNGEKNSVVE